MWVKTKGAWSLGHKMLCRAWDLKKRNGEINITGILQKLGVGVGGVKCPLRTPSSVQPGFKPVLWTEPC